MKHLSQITLIFDTAEWSGYPRKRTNLLQRGQERVGRTVEQYTPLSQQCPQPEGKPEAILPSELEQLVQVQTSSKNNLLIRRIQQVINEI